MVDGVVHLDEEAAVFEAMLAGWARQQNSRLLADATVAPRLALLRRFREYADSYPWAWGPDDVEDFTVALMSGEQRLGPLDYPGLPPHVAHVLRLPLRPPLRVAQECRDRFGQVPSQPCHEWNTVAHLNEYEGNPARRPFSYDELQALFDFLDDRVERVARSGRKGALAALRDAQMIKTAYAFGLRRNELCRLDVADLRPNPHVPDWGTYGSIHVRYGKAVRGGVPRRRTVLAVPEFDWAIDGLRQWVRRGPADSGPR